MLVMYNHIISTSSVIKSHITIKEKIICKPFFDYILFISGTYDEIIKEFILFADADAEEIGKAVIESFMESERYYNMG